MPEHRSIRGGVGPIPLIHLSADIDGPSLHHSHTHHQPQPQEYFSKLDKDYTMCIHEADQEMIGRFDKLWTEGALGGWITLRLLGVIVCVWMYVCACLVCGWLRAGI